MGAVNPFEIGVEVLGCAEEQVHGALKATGVTKGKVKRGAPGVLFKLGSISSKCADRLYRCKVNCSIYPNNSGRCDV